MKVTTDIPITTGTKNPETLSAILCTGAFPEDAFITRFMIFAKPVSFPVFSARIFT